MNNQLSVKIITWNMGKSVTEIHKDEWPTEIKKFEFDSVKSDIIFITLQETTKEIGDYFKPLLQAELSEYTIFSEGNGSNLAKSFFVYGYLCVKNNAPHIIINKHPIENDVNDKTIDNTCITKNFVCTKPSVEFGIVINNIKLIFIASHLPIITKNDPSLGYKERKLAMKTIFKNVEKTVSKAIGGYNIIFWAGDMNYRINSDGSEQLHTLLNDLPNELPHLIGFKETEKTFSPTCRFVEYHGQNFDEFVKQRPYDSKRIPSFCDRIIYKGDFAPLKYYNLVKELKEYPLSIAYSDHEPVVLEGVIGKVDELKGGDIDYAIKYYKYKAKYLKLKNN